MGTSPEKSNGSWEGFPGGGGSPSGEQLVAPPVQWRSGYVEIWGRSRERLLHCRNPLEGNWVQELSC